MKFTYLLIVLVLASLVACNSSPLPGNGNPPPDNGNPPPGDPNACAVVISESITVATRLAKTDRACDYLFQPPGTAKGMSVENGPLIVDPGVVIKLAKDTMLTFANGGSLQAVGTPEAPIRIEGAQPIRGYAAGLRFNASGNAPVNTLEHVQIAHMGRERHVISSPRGAISGSGVLSMKHTTVQNSNFHGANLGNINVVAFENNTFANNAQAPLVITDRDLHLLDNASDYLGASLEMPNGFQAVRVAWDSPSGAIHTQAVTWRNLSAPYFIGNTMQLSAGEVTIEPGTVFVFDDRASMSVRGEGAVLKALGTAQAPIIFTSLSETPGAWSGITVSRSAQAFFEYAAITYGGAGATRGGIIELTLGLPYVSLKNSRVAHSATCGVWVRSGLAEWDAGTVFENNQQDVCN